jgi:hypothetical protein
MEKKTSGQDLDQVSDGQEKSTDIKQDMVSYESHRKLLGEKKARDAQLAEMQEKLKIYEQNQAEAEGRKDDVIKALREELSGVKTELTKTKTSYAYTTIEGQIKAAAAREGCVNPDKLVRLLGEDALKGIDVDDRFQVNKEDLQRIVAKAKEENSDIGLFKSKTVNINDMPSSNNIAPSKGLHEMSKAELEEYARANLK